MDLRKSSQSVKDRQKSMNSRIVGANPDERARIFRCSISSDKWAAALDKAKESDVNKG